MSGQVDLLDKQMIRLGELLGTLEARRMRLRTLYDSSVINGIEYGGELYRLRSVVAVLIEILEARIEAMPPLD